jgi:hypothetical protein
MRQNRRRLGIGCSRRGLWLRLRAGLRQQEGLACLAYLGRCLRSLSLRYLSLRDLSLGCLGLRRLGLGSRIWRRWRRRGRLLRLRLLLADGYQDGGLLPGAGYGHSHRAAFRKRRRNAQLQLCIRGCQAHHASRQVRLYLGLEFRSRLKPLVYRAISGCLRQRRCAYRFNHHTVSRCCGAPKCRRLPGRVAES